jgi:spermidine synthase
MQTTRAGEAIGAYQPPGWLGFVLGLACFVSGFAALVYEIVWTRQLSLAFGSTAVAGSTCLAAYLGGLALGAHWFGRRADSMASPLRTYAWMEALIGIYGALSFLVLPALGPIHISVSGSLALPRLLSGILQFVLAGGALFIPTALMGGTLPVLIGAFRRRDSSLACRLSILYGANITGAILGAAAAGLWLLPQLGHRRSVWVAALINVALAAGAFVASRKVGRTEGAPAMGAPGGAAAGQLPLWAAYGVAALTGYCTLHYEVLWIRCLEVVLGGSAKSFTLVVATFLVGLAAGVWLSGWALRRALSAGALLAAAQVGVAVSILLSVRVFEKLPGWYASLYAWLGHQPQKFWASQALLAGAVLILPAIFLGMILPLLFGAVRAVDREGRLVGRLYAVNTAGNLAGAVLAVLVMIPWLGIQRSLWAGVLVNLGLAALVTASRSGLLTGVRWALVAGLAAAGWVGVWSAPRWDAQLLTVTTHANPVRYAVPTASWERRRQTERVIFYKEGATATVAVREWAGHRWLTVDGRVEGGTTNATQALLGHAPFWLGRKLERVFVIGMGTGNTAAGVAAHAVKQVEVAEIEPAVIEAAGFFSDINRNVLQNPLVRLWPEDARNVLANRSAGYYDAIISQPSHPWVAGASKLFTSEFYRLARSRLSPNGVFVQWVQLYGLEEAGLLSFLGTFREVFPQTLAILMAARTGELVLLGGLERPILSWEILESGFRSEPMAADLRRVGFGRPGTLLARILLGPEEMAALTVHARRNTDDNGYLEYASLAAQYLDSKSQNLRVLRQAATDPWRHVQQQLDPHKRAQVLSEMAATFFIDRELDRALSSAREATELAPSRARFVLLGDILLASGRGPEAAKAWIRSLDFPGERRAVLSRLVAYYRSAPPAARPEAYGRWLSELPPAARLDEPPLPAEDANAIP